MLPEKYLSNVMFLRSPVLLSLEVYMKKKIEMPKLLLLPGTPEEM